MDPQLGRVGLGEEDTMLGADAGVVIAVVQTAMLADRVCVAESATPIPATGRVAPQSRLWPATWPRTPMPEPGQRPSTEALPPVRHASGRNEPRFDVRAALFALLGADLSQIQSFGPYTVLRLVAECGQDMTRWPTAKHFTSWLSLAPGNKISGGRLLSSKTRRSSNRAAALLRIAAVNVGRTQTAIGAFYRRLGARIGKAKAVTATARKLAILFYNALRFGMTYVDPGVTAYDARYRQRVLRHLHRRARDLGFRLVPATSLEGGVS